MDIRGSLGGNFYHVGRTDTIQSRTKLALVFENMYLIKSPIFPPDKYLLCVGKDKYIWQSYQAYQANSSQQPKYITLVKMDSNTIFNLEDFRPFQKVGNDKRILDSGKKLNLGEGILHKCKFHGKLCTCYFSYAQFDDVLINGSWVAQLVQRQT